MHQNTNKPNTQEVVLPAEVDQNPTNLPTAMPRSPLDWPVERFTQALTALFSVRGISLDIQAARSESECCKTAV